MATGVLGKRKRLEPTHRHPYLTGNFAPIQKTCPLTPCSYTGTIPLELIGGQYVRNGSNPVSDEDLGRDAHWFDGDGMLSGVSFKRTSGKDGEVEPEFVNQYILTDIYLSTISTPSLKKPILPSITTLVNPFSSLFKICMSIFRAILLVLLSRFPGSEIAIKKISVANTSILYHDGRALATCESGPPMRIQLPSLDTVGWFDGNRAEGEPENEKAADVLGGSGLLGFMKEWTTAHPKVDPKTNEMMLFHSTFLPPYIHYSVIPATQDLPSTSPKGPKLLNSAVAGVSSAKMMHDFGVSPSHTVIMDLPLSLDPLQLAKNKPPITYDSSKPSRFGIFPRHDSRDVRWFQTSACCIFHTVNTWDVHDAAGELQSIDMLACRMTSATLVFSAGNIAAPQPSTSTVKEVASNYPKIPDSRSEFADAISFDQGPALESPSTERDSLLWNLHHEQSPEKSSKTSDRTNNPPEDDQCRLYYYSFSMSSPTSENTITDQWALSAITFEFPCVRPDLSMSSARYIYGCTTTIGTFNSALGRAAKIDAIAKFDVRTLISCGKANPPTSVTGCVDARSVAQVLQQQDRRSRTSSASSSSQDSDPADTIQIFQTPAHHYAQEPRFIPSSSSSATEDAGYLLTYIFNESQLTPAGDPPSWACSELWIIDAKGMRDVLAKVTLPQRVPYGLHGSWFSEEQVLGQRAVTGCRRVRGGEEAEAGMAKGKGKGRWHGLGRKVVGGVVRVIGG